jgi:hypothetical protein
VSSAAENETIKSLAIWLVAPNIAIFIILMCRPSR